MCWIFDNFQEIMEKEPYLIYSDQEPAIVNGIRKSSPNADYRICAWHISRNLGSKFKYLKAGGQEDLRVYNHIINLPFEEDRRVFEKSYQEIMNHEEIDEERLAYFVNVYQKKRSFATCYLKEKFCAGINTTGRIESIHAQLKSSLRSYSKLQQMFVAFNNIETIEIETLEGESSKEKIDFQKDLHLRHLSNIYTPYAIKRFISSYKRFTYYTATRLPHSEVEMW